MPPGQFFNIYDNTQLVAFLCVTWGLAFVSSACLLGVTALFPSLSPLPGLLSPWAPLSKALSSRAPFWTVLHLAVGSFLPDTVLAFACSWPRG